MKLLITSGLFYPSTLGGPANTLYWLAKSLVRRGVEVTVIATYNHIEDNSISADLWKNIEGIDVIYCRTGRKFSWAQLRMASRELKKCDVLMLSSICYIPNIFIGLMAMSRGTRIIWSPRGELMDGALMGNRAKLMAFKAIKYIFHGKILFHATSEEERQSINVIFGERYEIVVIPNYIELPDCRPKDPSSEKYFLYVGRLNRIKALDILVRALGNSKYFLFSGYKFYFVGPDQNGYQRELVSIAEEYEGLSDKLVFFGNVIGERKYEFYSNARFSFLVSHSENFGNVVIEALSQGTPVVASTGTPWQDIAKSNAGYWLDNTCENLAKVIDDILEMKEIQYQEMRRNARLLSLQYDAYENSDKWMAVLQMK